MTSPATVTYLSFADVEGYLKPLLAELGLKPRIAPGPASRAVLQKLSPGPILFLTVGGGAGLTTEYLFDRTFITVRAIGEQNNYGSAERLAFTVDRLLLALSGSAMIGSTYTLGVSRTGGSPQLLDQDSADRYHLTCSYIAHAETGL